jgi:hypothetical protein
VTLVRDLPRCSSLLVHLIGMYFPIVDDLAKTSQSDGTVKSSRCKAGES